MPPEYNIMKHFTTEGLPLKEVLVARPFCMLADTMAQRLPYGEESKKCLDKIMEAMDCALRVSRADKS